MQFHDQLGELARGGLGFLVCYLIQPRDQLPNVLKALPKFFFVDHVVTFLKR
jgi:hypothetical protein